MAIGCFVYVPWRGTGMSITGAFANPTVPFICLEVAQEGPKHGEHNREIFIDELDLSESTFADLQADEVI